MKCIQCGSEDVRIGVNVFMYIHPKYDSKLTKKAIATKDVEIWGANWPGMSVVCRSCGYIQRREWSD